jgi:CrcB protein
VGVFYYPKKEENMVEKFTRHFYDSHPDLPVDPDSDELRASRPMHTDPAHIMVVAVGAFFGTLLRYGMSLWVPVIDGWPLAILLVNVIGAFLLGGLLQSLLHYGKDEGSRRILRLLIGTGFCGSFTTYSSLATGTVLLARSNEPLNAIAYMGVSIVAGILAVLAGIRVATWCYGQWSRA